MNPTDKVDDLLAKAGAQWRASQPSAPEPDLDRITGGSGKQQKRRWLVPTLAAASVAAIAVAALTVLPDNSDNNEPAVAPPANSSPTPQLAEGSARVGKPSAQDLLVSNGDKVEVNGQVIAAPGQDPVYCQVLVRAAPASESTSAEPAPNCGTRGIKLIGFDPAKITDPQTIQGVRVGNARIVGIWKDRTITVEEQTPYQQPPGWAPDALACPAPPGGWKSKPSNFSTTQVQNFLKANEGVISGTRLKYPAGQSRTAPVVIAVGVAKGDLDAFRARFEKIFTGNLCVFQGKVSLTENNLLTDRISDVMGSQNDLDISSGGGQGPDDGTSTISLLVVNQKVLDAFTPIGLEKLTFEPEVKPIR
ncbi:hypothetical protein AB0P21_22755 [Kribbella sp. NPDC056861]|uniref:hypothetical protein n=1 Tax=Kribbella sp. NPDC056861 TaxID=3154857 RepID=UPI003436B9B1